MNKIIDLSQPIIVTMESFSHLKDAKLVSDDGSIFEGTLIECDTISRNRTMYPLEDVISSMEDDFFKERLQQNVLFGEAEHPTDDSEEGVPLKRLLRVEPSRRSHRIDSYWVEGNLIKAIIQWCGPFGEQYRKDVVESGSNYAMSIRAYTPTFIQKQDARGKYVVKKHKMFITTFDCVTKPGLYNARIMDPNKYAEINKKDKLTLNTPKIISFSKSNRLTNENFVEVSYKKPIDEIRDMLHSSESADIVSNIFGINFDKTNMSITDKNTLSVISEEGVRLHLPLKHTILSKVL